MKVKQPILTKVEGPSLAYAITGRVELSCTLVEEIDAHPDAARIWATIRALRAEHEAAVEQAYEEGFRDAS